MRTFKRKVLQVLPVVAVMMADPCVGCRAAAHAAPVAETRSITVSVKDLDLTTHAGAVAAYTRIRNAARSVCGISDIFLEERAARERCVDEAIGSAVAKLRVPELTHYYLSKATRAAPMKRALSAESALAGALQ